MAPNSTESLATQMITAFMKFGRTPWHNAPASGLSQVETDILENIMRMIRHGRTPRVSDISLVLRVSSPTVTQHLNNLEAQGFVERVQSKEDKRSVHLSLTEKGNEALRSHWARLEGDFAEFIATIGEEKSEAMIELFKQAQDFFTHRAKTREAETILGS